MRDQVTKQISYKSQMTYLNKINFQHNSRFNIIGYLLTILGTFICTVIAYTIRRVTFSFNLLHNNITKY